MAYDGISCPNLKVLKYLDDCNIFYGDSGRLELILDNLSSLVKASVVFNDNADVANEIGINRNLSNAKYLDLLSPRLEVC